MYRVIYINIFRIVKTLEHFVVVCKFGGVVGRWMSTVEDHVEIGGAEKASTIICWVVHWLGRATKYGNICLFGVVGGCWMCEAEEDTRASSLYKASVPKCIWVLWVRRDTVGLDHCTKLGT